MATLNDLRNAVEQIFNLPTTGATLQLNNNTRERAFEAYIFALVTRAVRQAGGRVAIVGIRSGINPATVVFRGAPGRIGSAAQDFAYAECALNGKGFEIHVDVQFLGGSGATHEVDVAIVDHLAAENARNNPQFIVSASKVLGTIECKFFDSALGTALGRTFVGLCSDMGHLRVKFFATNGTNFGLAKYLSKDTWPSPVFQLSPLRPDVESRFVSTLEQKLREWAAVA